MKDMKDMKICMQRQQNDLNNSNGKHLDNNKRTYYPLYCTLSGVAQRDSLRRDGRYMSHGVGHSSKILPPLKPHVLAIMHVAGTNLPNQPISCAFPAQGPYLKEEKTRNHDIVITRALGFNSS